MAINRVGKLMRGKQSWQNGRFSAANLPQQCIIHHISYAPLNNT
jgi:hypothetical protein